MTDVVVCHLLARSQCQWGGWVSWDECKMDGSPWFPKIRRTTNNDQCHHSSSGCHITVRDMAPGFHIRGISGGGI